jgi:hypothetical protein
MCKRRITTVFLALLAMLQLMTFTTAFAADVQIYSMTTDGAWNGVRKYNLAGVIILAVDFLVLKLR